MGVTTPNLKVTSEATLRHVEIEKEMLLKEKEEQERS